MRVQQVLHDFSVADLAAKPADKAALHVLQQVEGGRVEGNGADHERIANRERCKQRRCIKINHASLSSVSNARQAGAVRPHKAPGALRVSFVWYPRQTS